MHKNCFENPLEIITAHFLARQLTVFSCAIHNTEKQSTGIAEMKTDINKLLLMSQHRKSGSFFTRVVQDQLKQLVEDGRIIYE